MLGSKIDRRKVADFCIKVTSSHLFFHFLTTQTNFRLYTLFWKKVGIFKTGSDQKSIEIKDAHFCKKITSNHLFFHFLTIQTNYRFYALFSKKVQKGWNFLNRLKSKIDSKEKCRFLHKNHFWPFVFPIFDHSDQFQALCTFLQKGGNI